MRNMKNWLAVAQAELGRLGLPGWLIYDFRGLNPIAQRFLTLGPGMLTRRVFLFVPAEGEPVLLVHAIEAGSLDRDLPLTVRSYSSHGSLREELAAILPAGPLALEYSPGNDIPYLSFVDAGTMEMLRSVGVEPVSSADLLQVFSAWTDGQMDAHRRAAAQLLKTKDAAFSWIDGELAAGRDVREAAVQDLISDELKGAGLEFAHAAIVGFGPNASDPHYAPVHGSDKKLERGDVVLIDLFAREAAAGAPYADITWCGVYGEAAAELETIFRVAAEARDLGVDFMRRSVENGEYPRGCDVDDTVRGHIEAAGYGRWFTHRTGHSIGLHNTHGEAAHLDNFETHDTRRILPGVAVTIEPGIYLPQFGVRTEINLIMHGDGPETTTAPQDSLIRLGRAG